MPRNQYGRADINFRSFFQDFNMSKFVVYTSLLIFSMLFALKRDGILHWSWWSIFIPLFIWKGFAGKLFSFLNLRKLSKKFFGSTPLHDEIETRKLLTKLR